MSVLLIVRLFCCPFSYIAADSMYTRPNVRRPPVRPKNLIRRWNQTLQKLQQNSKTRPPLRIANVTWYEFLLRRHPQHLHSSRKSFTYTSREFSKDFTSSSSYFLYCDKLFQHEHRYFHEDRLSRGALKLSKMWAETLNSSHSLLISTFRKILDNEFMRHTGFTCCLSVLADDLSIISDNYSGEKAGILLVWALQ